MGPGPHGPARSAGWPARSVRFAPTASYEEVSLIEAAARLTALRSASSTKTKCVNRRRSGTSGNWPIALIFPAKAYGDGSRSTPIGTHSERISAATSMHLRLLTRVPLRRRYTATQQKRPVPQLAHRHAPPPIGDRSLHRHLCHSAKAKSGHDARATAAPPIRSIYQSVSTINLVQQIS